MNAPLVAHVIYSLDTGGLENGLVNIINRCPPGRYRHAIVCLTEAHEFARRLDSADIEIVELKKRPGHDPLMYWRLWRTLRRLQPAIVHTRNLAALETQVLGIFMPGVRRVHGEHGRDIFDLEGTKKSYRWLRQALRPLIHAYIAVSQDLARWLASSIDVDPARIHQVYNGVDSSVFSPRGDQRPAIAPAGFLPAADGIVFGTVGRLVEIKNQALLLEALALLLQRQPQWRARIRMMIVGHGPLLANLEQSAQSLGVADVVWMPGDRTDIPDLLKCMDVFLLPSLREGISNTVLEAMATALPVVASRVGGSPELVEDGVTGYLVPVGEAQATSEVMEQLASSVQRRQQMGHAGRLRVEREFNWDTTISRYLAVYDQVLPRQRMPQVAAGSGANRRGTG